MLSVRTTRPLGRVVLRMLRGVRRATPMSSTTFVAAIALFFHSCVKGRKLKKIRELVEVLVAMSKETQGISDLSASGGKTLFGMLPGELKALVAELGEKGYRATQIIEALYRQRVTDIAAMTALSAALREELGLRE